MNETLAETLDWAVKYEVDIKIIRIGETFVARADRGRISAEYPIDVDDATSLAGAVWAAIYSVKAGTEYHRVHGYTPGLNLEEGGV